MTNQSAINDVLLNVRHWHVETSCALAGLRMLPDNCVQCVVTSPPYWGLRDYKVEPSVWGGSPECEHDWGKTLRSDKANGFRGPNGVVKNEAPCPPKAAGRSCSKCGAWLGCYGLEPTPQMFVANTVIIFREVRRVLRDDGTLWLNIGDSWNAYNGGSGPGGWNDARDNERPQLETGYGLRAKGLKPKDLCGIPWRVALALQEPWADWQIKSEVVRQQQLMGWPEMVPAYAEVPRADGEIVFYPHGELTVGLCEQLVEHHHRKAVKAIETFKRTLTARSLRAAGKTLQASQAKADERERRFGPELDSLEADELEEMCRGNEPMMTRFKENRQSPLLREWLLVQLEKRAQVQA